MDTSSLTPADVLQLQRTIGNRATGRLLTRQLSVQAQLQLGPANDKYEQEADDVARQVVRRMAAPPVQRADELDEEVQAKPRYDISDYTAPQPAPVNRAFFMPKVQRDEMDDELDGDLAQTKPLAASISSVQRSEQPAPTKGTFRVPQVQPLAVPNSATPVQRAGDDDFRKAIRSRRGQMTGMSSEEVEQETAIEDFVGSAGKRATAEAQQLTGTITPEGRQAAANAIGIKSEEGAGGLEKLLFGHKRRVAEQQESGQVKSTITPEGRNELDNINQIKSEEGAGGLEKLLFGHKRRVAEQQESGQVKSTITPEGKKSLSDVTGSKQEYGPDGAMSLIQKAKTERVAALAQPKYDLLETEDKKALESDSTHQDNFSKFKKQTKNSFDYWQSKQMVYEHIFAWAKARLGRRYVLAILKGEVDSHPVVGQFADAYRAQATLEYNKVSGLLLTASRSEVKKLMTSYRKALDDLAGAHKKVADLDKNTGARYGGEAVQSLMGLVTGTISNVLFDVGKDISGLDEQIEAVQKAVAESFKSLQGRMKTAGEREALLTEHSTKGQDVRGKDEETAAIEKAKLAFETVQNDLKGREDGINNKEIDSLKDSTDVLSSFADREKETKAHDMKAKYEAAPYFLDTRTSKVVHAERHIKGASKYKTAIELEKDYKDEVDKQYIASKSVWCKYLGYTKGTGNARVTATDGNYDGKNGHHSVFLGDYSVNVNAKVGKASEQAADRSAASLLNELYPNAGTGGAHYTLEFTDPKPHAYRGGPTIPGARYQNDRSANNQTWQNAKNYMEQRQTTEEARVLALIQAALVDHMKVVHRRDPSRRK